MVRIGGGATWGQVATGVAPSGLAISAGDTTSVGVGGLTLAGGIGWKVREYGLALDSWSARMVIADGDVVRASGAGAPGTVWTIRGGGGNVGIVTAFEFMAHPTTEVFHGRIAFPVSEVEGVLHGWADYLRAAPDELTSVVNLANPRGRTRGADRDLRGRRRRRPDSPPTETRPDPSARHRDQRRGGP